MKKVLIICGPTAVGKTDLALKLAKDFNGELISVDSRQVYQGMDIGTGKDVIGTTFEPVSRQGQYSFGFYRLGNVKIWLYDLVKPDYLFSAVDFHFCANKIIGDIWQRSKLPILVGGSGFYLKTLFGGLDALVPPDWKLRTELSTWSLVRLKNKLKRLSLSKFDSLNQSDVNNPRRLVRAIEIASAGNKSTTSQLPGLTVDSSLWLGLRLNYPSLYQRIDERVGKRLDQGVVKEIEALLGEDYGWSNSVLGTTLGYRQWQPFFEKKTTVKQVIEKWCFAEHKFARRQMTWFRKQKQINWFDVDSKSWQKDLRILLKEWYYKS